MQHSHRPRGLLVLGLAAAAALIAGPAAAGPATDTQGPSIFQVFRQQFGPTGEETGKPPPRVRQQTASERPGAVLRPPAPVGNGRWVRGTPERERPAPRHAAPEFGRPGFSLANIFAATTAPNGFDPKYLPTVVAYNGREKPGTIIVDTPNRFLYLIEPGGKARRYGIGVGRPGFSWAGRHRVTRKEEWPDWTPPPQMRRRQPGLPAHMKGGPGNPLGARALYLGSTLYRIHGTSEPWTIGHAVSSGCIRLRNQDVVDLYNRVPVGAMVIVR